MVGSWLESLDYSFQISDGCVRYRSPKASCTNCFEHCKEDAIVFEKGKPVIIQEKCTECGDCMIACPVQMIEGIYPKRSAIGKQLDIREEAEPIPVKELLILHACGLTSILATEEKLTQSWLENIEEANTLLEKLELTSFIIKFSTDTKNDLAYSRRQFFSLWKKEGESILKDVTPAQWRFNHESLNMNKYYPDHQFYSISIDLDKCTLCKTCEFVCAKNCFQIKDGQFIVSSQDCYHCRLCEDTCVEEAIHIQEQIAEKELMTFETHEVECDACHNKFQTLHEEDETCHVCARRKNNYLSSGVC